MSAHSARFNLSQLLVRVCPTSPAAQAFAQNELAAHPDWVEEDEEGYLRRITVRWGSQRPSPISAEALLRLAPNEAFGVIQAVLRAVSPRDEVAPPLFGAFQQALRANAQWGLEVFLIATTDDSSSDDMLEAMIWALSETEYGEDDERRLLARLKIWTWPQLVTRALGSLLDRWATRAEGAAASLLDDIDAVADIVYDRGQKSPPLILNKVSWTDQAINHPCGLAALSWWQVANNRDRIDGKVILTVDDAERQRWSRVLNDDSQAGGYARAILGMASERLSSGDFPWANQHLFPAFDPRNGTDKAAQLWDGRFAQQAWSRNTLAGLDPVLEAFFAVSAKLVPQREDELGDWMALIVAHPEDASRSGVRLRQFVGNAAPEARRAFATKLPRHMAGLTDDQRRQLWQDVLQPYWHDRRTHVPLALDGDEVAGMVAWVTELIPVANEVLAELRQTRVGKPSVARGERLIISWSQHDSWLREHPVVAASLIRWLADEKWLPEWVLPQALSQLETAIAADPGGQAAVLAAAEALASAAYPPAATFAARLRSSGGAST